MDKVVPALGFGSTISLLLRHYYNYETKCEGYYKLVDKTFKIPKYAIKYERVEDMPKDILIKLYNDFAKKLHKPENMVLHYGAFAKYIEDIANEHHRKMAAGEYGKVINA